MNVETQVAEVGFHTKSSYPLQAESCPRCPILEARLTQLEKWLEEAGPEKPGADSAALLFRALRTCDRGWGEGWTLVPSPTRRPWMDQQPFSYQCLPLVTANQWGWQIGCPAEVRATWDGNPSPTGLTVEVAPAYNGAIKSQFGQGILTFSPPWLFQTPAGWDLYCKGPNNHWKPNCAPLEGVIETWWLPYTFTLNWKLVEPGTVTFQPGEPLAQLIPVPHATFQGSQAVEVPIDAVADVKDALQSWQTERQRRADQPVNTHHLYRKAEFIPQHLVRIPVPPVVRSHTP